MVGWALCYPLMGPIVRSATHGWMLRWPIAITFATFLGVQASAWERPSKVFHEVISQPAPHGGYLRRTLKEHFPVWWNSVSANMYKNGYSFPEMNEYDKSTTIQKSHTQFDNMIQWGDILHGRKFFLKNFLIFKNLNFINLI